MISSDTLTHIICSLALRSNYQFHRIHTELFQLGIDSSGTPGLYYCRNHKVLVHSQETAKGKNTDNTKVNHGYNQPASRNRSRYSHHTGHSHSLLPKLTMRVKYNVPKRLKGYLLQSAFSILKCNLVTLKLFAETGY